MKMVAHFVVIRVGNDMVIPSPTTNGSHPLCVRHISSDSSPYQCFRDDVDNYVKTSYPTNYNNKTYSAAVYSRLAPVNFRLPIVPTKSYGFSPISGWSITKTYFPNRSDPNDR